MNADTLREFLESRLEDEETPSKIAAWCDAHAGKQIRANVVPDFCELERRQWWPELHATPGGVERDDAQVYQLARLGGPAVWPSGAELEEMNPAYFVGATARNAARRLILDTPGELERVAATVERVRAAIVEYNAARGEMMGALFETGDEYRVEELIGGRLVKREY